MAVVGKNGQSRVVAPGVTVFAADGYPLPSYGDSDSDVEVIATLTGTIASYSLTKDTYRVVFDVPITDAAEVIKLNDAIQRFITIRVEKRAWMLDPLVDEELTRGMSFLGSDE